MQFDNVIIKYSSHKILQSNFYRQPSKMDITPFAIPNKFLLGAGPSNCSERVLKALAHQSMAPVDKDTVKLLDDTREKIKQIFYTKNTLTFAQQTSGSGGLETSLVNLVEPGQKIIVAIGGVWGVRVSDIAEKYGIEVVRMNLEPGEVYSFKELEEAIKKHRPVLIYLTHGESSTGVLQPLDGLGDICHKYNCLLAVDAIITIGSDPLFVDDWKLDAVVGATQKGIGAPAGFALLTFSPLAEEVIMKRKNPIPFYFDAKGIGRYWNCFPGERCYYYTYSTNMIAALREAIAEKLEEGMDNVWERHRQVAEKTWKSFESIGIYNFVKKRENRLHSVCTYVLPEGVDWRALLDYLYDKKDIALAFGIGPTSEKAVRIGLMGTVNARLILVDHLTKAMKEGMDYCKNNNVKGEARLQAIY